LLRLGRRRQFDKIGNSKGALADGGSLQLSVFDDHDLDELVSPDYPGERPNVFRNPLLAAQCWRRRTDLLAATERDLGRIKLKVERSARRCVAPPSSAFMGKHTPTPHHQCRKQDAIAPAKTASMGSM
jgi:hypothetical protein